LIFHLWDVGIVIPERIYDGGKNDMWVVGCEWVVGSQERPFLWCFFVSVDLFGLKSWRSWMLGGVIREKEIQQDSLVHRVGAMELEKVRTKAVPSEKVKRVHSWSCYRGRMKGRQSVRYYGFDVWEAWRPPLVGYWEYFH
jgi:hypothetical protein